LQAIVDSKAFPSNRIGVRLALNGTYGDMGSDDHDIMFEFLAESLNKYGRANFDMMEGLGFGYHESALP
jgi:hypothetical protein